MGEGRDVRGENVKRKLKSGGFLCFWAENAVFGDFGGVVRPPCYTRPPPCAPLVLGEVDGVGFKGNREGAKGAKTDAKEEKGEHMGGSPMPRAGGGYSLVKDQA